MKTQLTQFEAAMTLEELYAGEHRHEKLDKFRRSTMLFGLTQSSNELKLSYKADTKAFMNTLGLGVETIDHYKNAIELLSGAIARLYAVANELGIPPEFEDTVVINRALEIISERPKESLDN